MSKIYDYLVEKNVLTGIIIFSIITLVTYIITIQFYFGIYLYADLQFLLGAIFGIFFTLKYKKPNQSTLKVGLFTAIGGGLLSAFFVYIYESIVLSIINGIIIIDILLLLYIALSGIIIGFLSGAILIFYFEYKETKTRSTKESKEDNLYRELEDDR